VLVLLAFSGSDHPVRVPAVGALWALASTAAGGALGYLFGVPRAPRVYQRSDTESDKPEPPKTNLEELADVLSKLILGGTLFESNKIVAALGDAGREFARTVGGQDQSLWSGAGSAIIIYFGLIGFFAGHFLPRYFKRQL
jgi:hypothetical protein